MPGRLAQVGHDRPGGVTDAALLGHELAELEQLEPETEPAVRALKEAAADQLAGQPGRRALRQPGSPGQLRQGQRVAAVPERLEQRRDPTCGGDLAAGLVSWAHESILAPAAAAVHRSSRSPERAPCPLPPRSGTVRERDVRS